MLGKPIYHFHEDFNLDEVDARWDSVLCPTTIKNIPNKPSDFNVVNRSNCTKDMQFFEQEILLQVTLPHFDIRENIEIRMATVKLNSEEMKKQTLNQNNAYSPRTAAMPRWKRMAKIEGTVDFGKFLRLARR